MKLVAYPALGATVIAAACAGPAPPPQRSLSLEERAVAATRIALENVVAPGDISVSGLKKTVSLITWHADIRKLSYACSSDEQFNLPDCRPVTSTLSSEKAR